VPGEFAEFAAAVVGRYVVNWPLDDREGNQLKADVEGELTEKNQPA